MSLVVQDPSKKELAAQIDREEVFSTVLEAIKRKMVIMPDFKCLSSNYLILINIDSSCCLGTLETALSYFSSFASACSNVDRVYFNVFLFVYDFWNQYDEFYIVLKKMMDSLEFADRITHFIALIQPHYQEMLSDVLKEYSVVRHVSSREEEVGEHFKRITGKDLSLRSYVESFDWELWTEDLKNIEEFRYHLAKLTRKPHNYISNFLASDISTDITAVLGTLDKIETEEHETTIRSLEKLIGTYNEVLGHFCSCVSIWEERVDELVIRRPLTKDFLIRWKTTLKKSYENKSKKFFGYLSNLHYMEMQRKKSVLDGKQVSEIIKEAWSGEAIMNFKICPEVARPAEGVDIYPINKYKLRGIVYILNISYEGKHPDREGSVYDVENITKLFEMLKYEVVQIKETKFEKIGEKLDEISKSERLRDAAIFIMFLMSHGKDQHLLDEDQKEMNITKVFFEPFYNDKCLQLANKPKLFFIQACREKQVKSKTEETKEKVPLFKNTKYSSHPCAHFFRFNSTFENYKSLRRKDNGSVFIRILLLSIANFCHANDLAIIVQNVNYLMDSLPYEKNFEGKWQQISSVDSKSLTKKVYFLPAVEDQCKPKIIHPLKN